MANKDMKETCICCFDSNGNKISAVANSPILLLLRDSTLVKGVIKHIEKDALTLAVDDVLNGSICSPYFGVHIDENIFKFIIKDSIDFGLI